MKRSGPIRRKTALRAKKPLARKSPLRARRKPQVTAGERRAMEIFGKAPPATVCAVCGRSKWRAWREGTKIEAHHVVAKQKVKQICSARRLPLSLLWDVRNRLWVCAYPCHQNHTDAVKRISRSKLRRENFEFARELGATYLIEREYPG